METINKMKRQPMEEEKTYLQTMRLSRDFQNLQTAHTSTSKNKQPN